MPPELDGGAARRLAAMAPNRVDATRAAAIKRNVHEVEIDAPADRFVEALGDVIADPSSRFGLLVVRRPAERVGARFAVGDRFAGCIRVSAAAAAWGAPAWLCRALDGRAVAWLENRVTSDHSEIIELGPREMAYRYLEGTPLAGESRYTITPCEIGCRLTVAFTFQETTTWAISLLHCLGIREHDRAVLEQARAAADRIGARVVSTTITCRGSA